MTNLIYIAGGGAIGALLRYFLSGAVHSFTDSMYPWGTLAVNLVGSFIAGFIWCLSEDIMIAPHVKTFIFIGILGAFTTFSTYMLETLNLFRDGETGLALYNLLLNNFLGIIVVFPGFFLSQTLINLFKQG